MSSGRAGRARRTRGATVWSRRTVDLVLKADLVFVVWIEMRAQRVLEQSRNGGGIVQIERAAPSAASRSPRLAVIAREEIVDAAVLHDDYHDVLDLRRKRDQAFGLAVSSPSRRRVQPLKMDRHGQAAVKKATESASARESADGLASSKNDSGAGKPKERANDRITHGSNPPKS